MNIIWGGVTILLVLCMAVLTMVVFIGTTALLVVSILEYIEKKLRIVTIGDKEEALIAQAEKLKEERRRGFKGPWTLTPKVKPHNSKLFQLFRAKEILEEK